jgi:hypothetical protein
MKKISLLLALVILLSLIGVASPAPASADGGGWGVVLQGSTLKVQWVNNAAGQSCYVGQPRPKGGCLISGLYAYKYLAQAAAAQMASNYGGWNYTPTPPPRRYRAR